MEMIFLINFLTQMTKENLLILEWKIFIISVKEIIGKWIKTKTGNLLKRLKIFLFVKKESEKNQQPRLIKIKAMKQNRSVCF